MSLIIDNVVVGKGRRKREAQLQKATKSYRSYSGIRSACEYHSGLAPLIIAPAPAETPSVTRPRGHKHKIAIRDASSHAVHEGIDVPLGRENHATSS